MPRLLRGRKRWSVILEQLKFCSGCKELKHVSEFQLSRRKKDGRQAYCRTCKNRRCAFYHRKNVERNALPWVARTLHFQTRKGARDRGLIYELSPEWFLAKLESGVCELTGLPLGKYGLCDPRAPSPDRLDNDIGYTDENTRVILWWINRAKSHLPEDVFQSLMREYAEAMYEHA